MSELIVSMSDLLLVCAVPDSIDAYRTQRQSKLPAVQSATPGVQRRAPEKSKSHQSVNTKEKITVSSFHGEHQTSHIS